MFEQLKLVAKQYKIPLILLVLMVIFTFIFNASVFETLFTPGGFNNQQSVTRPTLTPGLVIDPDNPDKKVPVLKLVRTAPPSGLRKSIESFNAFKLSYSAPLDETTIKVTVKPKIELKAVIFEDDPKSIVISPSNTPWVNDVRYDITVEVKGVDGEVMSRPTTYTYLNVFPENVPVPDIY